MSRASAEAKTGPLNISIDVARTWSRRLAAILTKLSSRLHGYLPAVTAVAVAFLLHHALIAVYGRRIPGIISIYVCAFLIAAWCGYGPGIVATLLITFGVPFQFRPNFTLDKLNLSNAAIYLVLSVAVSAKAAGRRKVELLLKTMNAELDTRVREQTTALAEANTKLQDRLAELETLYGKLSVGLCFLDRNLQFVRVNEKFAAISGVPMQEHLNRELREVIDEGLVMVLERLCRRVLATDEPVLDHEISVSPEPGALRYWSVSCSPVPSSNGVLGLQLAMQEITERKQAEYDLSKANTELRRANQDLEQFAYSASHDLQEPIRTVAIYSQMLKRRFDSKLGPEGDDYLRYTLDGALRMQQLVKDLLAYTQASAASAAPPEVVETRGAVSEALSNLSAAIDESGAVVAFEQLPVIRARRIYLVQLFQNLIANAIKYRRPVEAPLVTLAAQPDNNGGWVFSVADNGIGIHPRYHEQIFGLFKRLHVAAEYPGTGIGLAICRRIVERHGGRIWVESEPGAGATFFFTLPGSATERRS